jgi:hypothetical protein
MTSTSTMSMMPQARTNTQRECITEQNNDPVRLMSQESGCELIEQQVEGNTLRWQMRCAMDQGEATAQGRFTLNGDEADGEMLMEMSMQGMPVSMEMLWSGRRVGDC